MAAKDGLDHQPLDLGQGAGQQIGRQAGWKIVQGQVGRGGGGAFAAMQEQAFGQHSRRDQPAAMQNGDVADHVQQLAHIAGPGQASEQRPHLG